MNSVSDKLLTSVSFSTLSGHPSFPFYWGLFLCLPILGNSFHLFLHIRLICLDFLSSWGGLLSCATQWFNLLGLVSWILYRCPLCSLGGLFCCNWVLVGVGSFIGGFSPPLADWESQLPRHLVCCCTGVARTKQNNPANKITPAKIPPKHYHDVNNKWATFNKVGKIVRIL